MLLKELSVERFAFTCPGCRHAWTIDYDVQHVEDGHGHQLDYYYRNGLPAISPAGLGSVACPVCGRDHIHAKLTSRRTTPAVTTTPVDGLAHRPDDAYATARATVPLLTSEQETA